MKSHHQCFILRDAYLFMYHVFLGLDYCLLTVWRLCSRNWLTW